MRGSLLLPSGAMATTRFARAAAWLAVPATAQRGFRSAAGAHLAAGRRAMGGPAPVAGGTFWGAVGANISVKATALIAPHQVHAPRWSMDRRSAIFRVHHVILPPPTNVFT